MSDNLRANISCFQEFHTQFGSFFEYAVNHPIENNIFKYLFLIFDPVHLLKNIKNNWLTEKMKKLLFENFDTEETLIAEWKHIVAIYNNEKDHITKRTLLNLATMYPTNFDKQKVQLTLNVFHEKTVAVLTENDEYNGTKTFVRLVTRMINTLNGKLTYAADNLNDSDHVEKFESVDDDRFEFLANMATMFKQMDTATSKYPTRVMSLTSQTSNALSLSIRGIIEIIKMLSVRGMIKYVLQSDRLELLKTASNFNVSNFFHAYETKYI